MIYRTFGDLRAQVEREVDTEGEEFIQEAEMMSYFNSAVILCEASIVKLGLKEKYLQGEAFISTVAGQTDYPLPSDIVINKIRKITYTSPSTAYTIPMLTSEASYAYEDSFRNQSCASEVFAYSLYKVGNQQVIRFIPGPRLSVSNAVRVVYFKSLQRYTADSDLCDLPDICYEYLMSYVRYRIYSKETHVNTPDEKQNLALLQTLMQDTMQGQVADPDIEINEWDCSHYMEMN